MSSLISYECVAFRIESRSELKMDHSLVIFDSSDEMIFSPESATNSKIHFRIHRSSEEHYKILNDLFGTPAYSPNTDEDEDRLTLGINLSIPKNNPTRIHDRFKNGDAKRVPDPDNICQ